jgi:hypothetical protein
MLKKIALFLFVIVITSQILDAKPQYSVLMTYGAKCENCHVKPEGGVRNFPGFLARKDISLVKPSWIGMQGAFETIGETNTFADMFLFGLDGRYQTAKWGSPDKSVRDYMIMQLNPSLVITPVQWLQLEGSYNFAYDIEDLKRYPNQQNYSASAIIKPSEDLPGLRFGFFRPPVGNKYDDHTMLILRTADRGKSLPMIPHDYAELGIQLDYEPLSWLQTQLGVFNSDILSDMKVSNYLNQKIPLVNKESLSYCLRAVATPEIGSGLAVYAGGSLLLNNGKGDKNGSDNRNEKYFYLGTLFFGIGLTDKMSLIGEYWAAEKQHSFTSDNFMLEVDYQLMEPIILYARAERGTTRQRLISENLYYLVNQYVFGGQINLLPFIVLLPEYRIYDREAAPDYQGQWAFQVHLFF